MIHRLLLILIAVAAVSMNGCKKQEPALPPSETVVEEEVTEENLDSELDKMEAEINADIAAEE